MVKSSTILTFILLFSLMLGIVGVLGTSPALASEKDDDSFFPLPSNQAQQELDLICAYPVLEGVSGEAFSFQVDLRWRGAAYEQFTLNATRLPDWTVSILGEGGTKPIGAIGLDPRAELPQTVVSLCSHWLISYQFRVNTQ